MKRRKGFTLSELLVVVVIIGVLSAVVLPKFSKVIETRKTTEAEELMSVVRNEQEARCTLNRSYTDQTDKLGSYKDGKNYDYSLGTVGMSASAKSGKYKLEIPSYADGRICCSDIETGACNNLNKNYPLCSDLTDTSKTPDYVVGNQNCEVNPCIGEECYENPTPNPDEPIVNPECLSSHEMVPVYTDEEGCTVTTSWELKDYPTCWVSTQTKSNCPSNECDPDAKPATEKDCGCGYTQQRFVKCDASTNYQWEIQTGSNVNGSGKSTSDPEGWLTACGKPSGSRRAECPDLQLGSDKNGNWIKAYTYEDWNDETCQWELRDSECCQKHEDKNEACKEGEKGTGTVYKWNYPSCGYVVKSSDCYTTKKVWERETYSDSITRRSSGCGGCLEDHGGTYICNSTKAKAWWDAQPSHYPEDTYPLCSDIGVSAGMSAENYSGPTTCVLVKASYEGCGTTSTGWASQTGSDVGYVWPDGHTTRTIYFYAVIKRKYTILHVTEKKVVK